MRNRRRTRYRFNCILGGQKFERHILAYDRFEAEAWLLRRFEAVEYLGTGTGRAQRSSAPASAAKWRLDQGGRRGAYSFRMTGLQRYHHITVKNWLDPAQACRTLWHELAHAMQAERHNDPDKPFVVVQQAWADAPERRGPYRNRPIEVEARSYEDYGVEVQIAVAS